MAVNKIVSGFDEAVADVHDAAVLLIGGFGGPGECPSYLIAAVARKAVKNLTIVGNSGGWGPQLIEMLRARMAVLLDIPPDWFDPGLLVNRGQVKKGILSFPAAPAHIHTPFEQAVVDGRVELELIGQGSLAERLRAAKGGIAAFYTPVGVGTVVEEGKEKKTIGNQEYILELPLTADFALIKAHRADTLANLSYKGTARCFNPVMATAAGITIVEVDKIVEPGQIDPEAVVTPHVYVDRIVEVPR